jgi:hypothetical protein
MAGKITEKLAEFCIRSRIRSCILSFQSSISRIAIAYAKFI